MNNSSSLSELAVTGETVMGRLSRHIFGHESSAGTLILLVIGLAILAHLALKFIRYISESVIRKIEVPKPNRNIFTHKPKFITITRLRSGLVREV